MLGQKYLQHSIFTHWPFYILSFGCNSVEAIFYGNNMQSHFKFSLPPSCLLFHQLAILISTTQLYKICYFEQTILGTEYITCFLFKNLVVKANIWNIHSYNGHIFFYLSYNWVLIENPSNVKSFPSLFSTVMNFQEEKLCMISNSVLFEMLQQMSNERCLGLINVDLVRFELLLHF